MIQVAMMDDDGNPVAIATAETIGECISSIWKEIRCDAGPLSGEEPVSLEALANAIGDAFGGECDTVVDYNFTEE